MWPFGHPFGMPKGKGKKGKDSDSSSYEEVTLEDSEEAPASAAAKPKAKGPGVGKVSLSSSDSTSEETDPPRPVASSRKNVKNPSSNESEASAGPGKGKGKKGKPPGQVRCPYCWAKVSSGPQCLRQHQFWNSNCIAWQYYQRGVQWDVAKEKGQKKKRKGSSRLGPQPRGHGSLCPCSGRSTDAS